MSSSTLNIEIHHYIRFTCHGREVDLYNFHKWICKTMFSSTGIEPVTTRFIQHLQSSALPTELRRDMSVQKMNIYKAINFKYQWFIILLCVVSHIWHWIMKSLGVQCGRQTIFKKCNPSISSNSFKHFCFCSTNSNHEGINIVESKIEALGQYLFTNLSYMYIHTFMSQG